MPIPGLHRESPLQILFTSGTTSKPKGIVHTHGNLGDAWLLATLPADPSSATRRKLDLLRSYLAVDAQFLQAASGESAWRRNLAFPPGASAPGLESDRTLDLPPEISPPRPAPAIST